MISIKSKLLAPVIVGVVVVGIAGTAAFNLWKTDSTKEPVKYSSGEFAGQANPADIRGSYALADVVSAFGVPLEDLALAFGFEAEADPGAKQVKDIEAKYAEMAGDREIGTDSMRLFVALYKGLPMTPEETTGFPESAAAILLARAELSEAEVAEVKARTVTAAIAAPAAAAATAPAVAPAAQPVAAPAVAPAAEPAAQPAVEPAAQATAQPAAAPSTTETAPAPKSGTGTESATHTESEDDTTIKGKTTFNDLYTWGVAKDDVQKLFEAKITAPGVAIRDFCTAQGVEFATVKTKLQELVDAARK